MSRVRRVCAGLAAQLLVSTAAWAGAGEPPPCAACVAVVVGPAQVEALPAGLEGLPILIDAGASQLAAGLLDTIERRGGRPGLLLPLDRAATVPDDLTARAHMVVLHVSPGDPVVLSFALKARLTALRAASASAELGVAADGDLLTALLARGARDYLDVVVTSGTSPPAAGVGWWRRADLVLDAASTIEATRTIAAERWIWTAPQEPGALARFVTDLARARPLLTQGLLPSPDAALRCADGRGEIWLNPASLDLVSWTYGCAAVPHVDAPGYRIAEEIVLSSGHTMRRFSSEAGDRFAEGVEVRAGRRLSVGEIVARHQAAVARRQARVRALISTGSLALTFEAPGFPAPVTITSDSVIYADAEHTDIEQRRIRVNGLEFRGRAVPRLPLLEPERVASPPLAITLTDLYRYRLAGLETIAGVPCYVVAFEPVVTNRTLFRGKAWIAVDSFDMVRVAAAQTGLRGPIVSSEQIDEFRHERDGLWLLARSEVRQLYEGAGHRTPIHRVLEIAAHEINPPGFATRRANAYATAAVVLRDTPEGFRYLRRVAGEDPSEVQVVPTRHDRVRTLAAGVIIDPNITRPLPFAGLSYVDFNLFGTGTQLTGFFGGSYGQLALALPSIGGTRWQLGGRAFAIATSFHDRAFEDGRERYDRNIRQRPALLSAWLLRPLTPRIAVRAGYELDYTGFSPAESTAEDFRVPVDQVAHGFRLSLEGQRGGWSGTLWWNPVVRQAWMPWGAEAATDFHARHRGFQRYGVGLTRAAVLSPALVARVEASWMDGRDLDRFSRYAFGAFDNRLRGYPSALIRYDRGGALRSAVAWSARGRIRLDAFLDNAYVHDPGFGTGYRRFTGVGAALELPAPSGTLLAFEWGLGLQGVTATGHRGTHVLRLTAYKVF